jgi:Nucleoside-diphosphate-sugar pyrophosphorylase involved in lipopolysaccharide biosynthesis/translation initiation factor 2B, gamma/epsilon subunits (eIF-2Bgamma/eIF-2Bepsilon)
MKAMILGAGIGSRLDPLTRSLPKPVVPVVGKPVMGHLIDLLRRHGVTDIAVNVQYLGQKIIDTLGDGSDYGVRITYSREDELCGDAGGLKRLESFFRDGSDDTLLVLGGDDLTDTDISAVVKAHHEKGATATISVTPVEDPSEFGIAVHDDQGFITRFQEKPAKGEAFSNLANTGIYVFDMKVFDYIPADTFYGLGKNVLPLLLEKGEKMLAVPSDAYWKDVGNLTIYRQAQRDCIDGKVHVEFPKGAEVANTCVVCAGAKVDGEVRDYSVVGAGAVIEKGATVVNSVLWDGAVVKAGTYLENCVVGSGVTVASSHGIFQGLCVEPVRPK